MNLDGLQETDFQVWKHHPVTKVYLRYLADYRAMLLRELLARWEAGAIEIHTEKEIRGRTLTLGDLIDLQFASIEKFYQEEEEDNAAEIAKVITET